MRCTECGKTGHYWWDHGPVKKFGEDPIEPYTDDNLSSEEGGVEITTRGQRRKIMDEEHFEYRKKAPRLGEVMYFDRGAR